MNAQQAETAVLRPVLVADAILGPGQPAPGTSIRESGELLDDDLEHVVGGLARVWVDNAHISHGEHEASEQNAV